MAEQKYFDFDAFMKEKRGQDHTFVVKAFGEEYHLPNEVPFDIILQVKRMMNDGKKEIGEEELTALCAALFGQETFDDWLRKGISIDGIHALVEHTMSRYQGDAVRTSETLADNKRKSMDTP